ncbi:hypothetical protein [Raineya sp.]|jgi:hypothetical protein
MKLLNFNCKEVGKEDLHLFSFTKFDVLTSEEERKLRQINIEKGLKLGNLYQQKVFIYFRDVNSENFYVHTTIWAICEDVITLKGGRIIPIRAIYEVRF